MVIILCVCPCVCVSVCVCVRKILGKLRTLVAPTSYWQTSNYTRIKNNKRLLLKPFGYKFITIFITHGYCFQVEKTLGSIWTHQNITTPVSWLSLAKHYIKANKIGVVVATTSSTGSKHSPILSSSAYFKFSSHCCARDSNVNSFEDFSL